MKRLIAALFCAVVLAGGAPGQTVRSLGVNTTNGHVLGGYSPLTFSNALAFTTNTLADTTRQNLLLPWSGLTNANASGFRSALELSASWLTNTNTSDFRGAVGLGWSALTNTNAATALLGLDESGKIVANTGTNVLTFTNSIGFTTNAASETRSNLGLVAFRSPSGYAELLSGDGQVFASFDDVVTLYREIYFDGAIAEVARANSRANLGFSTNLNTLWTATSANDARNAIGLGTNSSANFLQLTAKTNFYSLANAVFQGTVNMSNASSVVINDANAQSLFVGNLYAGYVELQDGSTVYVDGGVQMSGTYNFDNILFSYPSSARDALGISLSAITNTSNVTMMRALAGSTNTNEPYSGSVAITNTNAVLVFSNGILKSVQ